MPNFTVYAHIFPNGKRYIGITMKKPRERWDSGHGYSGQKFMFNAIKKYGWDNIKHEILFSGLTQEEAEQKERELIAQYQTTNPEYGYNIDLGGSHQGKASEQTRKKLSLNAKKRMSDPAYKEKMRQANLGRTHITSEETKKKMSLALKGRKLSQDHIEKIRLSNRTRKISEETKDKMRRARLGRKFSEETRKKLSLINKERMKDPEYKRKFIESRPKVVSEETRKKMSSSHLGKTRTPEQIKIFLEISKRPDILEKRIKTIKDKLNKKVAYINDNGEVLQVFNSLKECAQHFNLSSSARVTDVCKGYKKHIHGLKFKYIEENSENE